MNRWIELLMVSLMLAVSPGWAQSAPSVGVSTPAPPSAEDTAKIETMLEEDDAVLQGIVSTYDPGTRRDPFRSLLAAAPKPELRGPRPEGLAGLLIDEIDISGIFKTSKGFVAQVQSQNEKKSFLLRPGDQVYDGDVLRIDSNEMVFRQIVNDPTVIKPFREVVKKLRP